MGHLGVEYSSVTPLLLACVEELSAEVAALKAHLAALEAGA